MDYIREDVCKEYFTSMIKLQAEVDRLEEIIRINGICDECGDGVQDWKDKDGNFTCGCKDES